MKNAEQLLGAHLPIHPVPRRPPELSEKSALLTDINQHAQKIELNVHVFYSPSKAVLEMSAHRADSDQVVLSPQSTLSLDKTASLHVVLSPQIAESLQVVTRSGESPQA